MKHFSKTNDSSKQIIYLSNMPKESVTAMKIYEVVKQKARYELGPNNLTINTNNNDKPFSTGFIRITDASRYTDVAKALRTFKIGGKECIALPFDNSFKDTND